jgi:hypothetical protein
LGDREGRETVHSTTSIDLCSENPKRALPRGEGGQEPYHQQTTSLLRCETVFERVHPLPYLLIFVMYVTLKVLHSLFHKTPISFMQ